jgi:hypothetical protein
MKKTNLLIVLLILLTIPTLKAQSLNNSLSAEIKQSNPAVTLNTNTKDPDSNRLAITEASQNICKVACYPNPATDHIQLNIIASAAGTYELTVISVNGQKMMHETIKLVIGNNQHSINVAAFPAGMYILNISSIMGNRQSLSFVRN